MAAPIIFFGNAAKLLKSSLSIPGSTSGLMTLSVPATITDYTLTFPSAQGGSGQALVNNGSGTLAWTTVPSSSTGSFTQGSIPFANSGGALTQDNAKFFWDDTNFRLGIGNSAPTVALDVTGAGLFSSTLSASNLSGTNTGDITLAAVGAVPSANGASLSGQVLTLQPADSTHPGLITAGTQTIGGNKTFSGSISAANLSGTNTGDQTITLTGDVTGSGTGSFAATIGSNVVTNAKLAQMAANTVKANNTGSTANASDIALASTATASSVMYRDSNGNSSLSNLALLLTSTVSSGGTLTLTASASSTQVITGTSAHTIKLPDATTLPTNWSVKIINLSTQSITINDNGNNLLKTMLTNSEELITNTSTATANGTWLLNQKYVFNTPLPITFGGTGQITATAAFDALSPMTTLGDIIYGGASGTGTRLAGDTSNTRKFLRTQSSAGVAAAPAWDTLQSGDIPAANLASSANGGVTGVLPVANGGTNLNAAGTDGQVLKSINSAFINSSYPMASLVNYVGNAFAETNTNGWATYTDTQTVTITNASPAVFTVGSTTGWYAGMPVAFTNSGGALPTGLTAGTTYYVSSVTNSTTFKVSATLGGADVNTSSNGSGTHTARPMVPVTATGGSPSGITLSRNTSSPIRGSADFKLAQTNSTVVQGQGVSFAFTIDAADEGNVLAVQFDFNASSTFVAANGQVGTIGASGVDSDIEIWVYDVTNAVLIPVSPKVITANGSNNWTFKGTFQTASNSTSYRLAMHCVTANANATGWSFRWSNVYVGPQKFLYGPPVTDWTAYTPTYSAGFGTVSTSAVWYRRVGDTLEVKGNFLPGTPVGSVASITIPSGLAIDSTKLPANTNGTIVGFGSGTASAGQNIAWGTSLAFSMFYDGSDTARLYFAQQDGNISGQFTKANGNSVAIAGLQVSLSFSVPISGWSSSTLMSNDANTRVVAAQYFLSANLAPGANTPINYDTKVYDTHGAVTPGAGTWKFTAPVTGIYWVNAFNGYSTGSGSELIEIYKNGSAVTTINFSQATGNTGVISGTTVQLTAGDTLDLRQHTGFTFTLLGGANRAAASASYIDIFLLNGPTVAAATDSVGCRYFASSTSVSGSLANITYTTKDYDTHSAYSAGTYTIPVAGKYQVNASIFMTATTTAANNLIQLQINKNGSAYSGPNDSYFTSSTSKPMTLVIGDIVNCLAGDTITIQASNAGSSPSISSSNSANYFSIQRVGN